ncbi:DUF3152 domain-containing protein [Corynebacterium uberis]|uniref:DUF3152 domain-containing protein n=1 Tax=Corynebacterium TaxID=1716 RepID=UPI001D0BCF4F|nr:MULTISPECIES: DUF3152 domain-containing protein [Corynebacterium]MCZ9309211.1 DUF3152 domain-containing protein [Corynebacterium sp. c6VSa_13]UDL72770.1 DUF3152 domain-containing protein [Corynebacterium uberis]UDL76353.1 DUF3152 domain-containing protein [Corynebacterium uberis]UDL78565.1 DUF3152 domain-containing protein [Corynebacterium uberis]UDL80846.1 DUF3152 domain-containing protein [Corynebacterium uberis]
MVSESPLVRFARDYGWRAYAIPVLAVITVWILVDVFTSPTDSDDAASAQVAATQQAGEHGGGHQHDHQGEEGKTGPNPADAAAPAVAPDQLPAGGPFTERGDATYRVIGTPGLAVGQGREKVVRYVIEVEGGVDTAGVGGDDALAAMIDATLANPKGWTHDPAFRFEHVGADQDPNMRIQLTSVGTTHELCGTNLAMETSCFYTDGNRVVINESRWVRGAAPFAGDVGSYRQYLINHEVGHGLGYEHHEPCRASGELAPVMMQQTLSLDNSQLHAFDSAEVYPDDHAQCLYNPWPYPKVAP